MSMRVLKALVISTCVAVAALFSGPVAARAEGTAPVPPIFQQLSFEAPSKNVAVDSQGRAWYTLPSVDKIAVVTPEGVVTYFSVDPDPTPGSSQPYDLVVEGNNVWFTLLAANKIGRLDTTNSAVTLYNVPTADSQPTGIAIGGGFIWFVERNGDKLGRLNPANGQFAEFYNWVVDDRNPVDMRDADLEDVAWSDDGIWIAGPNFKNSVAVYRISDNRFLPSAAGAGARPMQIAVDSLNNVWVTFEGRNMIGRSAINTLGVWDPYLLPTGASGPVGLFVRDYNGQRELWYTRPGSNRIGFVLTSFSGRRLAVWENVSPVPNSAPWGIAVNGSGQAWIAASNTPQTIAWNSPYFASFIYMTMIWR